LHDVDQNSLKELCFNVLSADKKIRFVGVVDAHGKLYLGKYRPDYHKENSSLIKASSFYSEYLIPTIQKNKHARKRRENASTTCNTKLELYFGLADFCNGTIKLIIIPLEDIDDRYLCVYTFS
jgi:hypothetical protein